MTKTLAKFQEALKTDEYKDLDVYEALGLDKPAPKVEEPKINQVKIHTIVHNFLQKALIALYICPLLECDI